MDLGGFAMALKYATNCEHVILGKPEETYFMHAIEDLGLTKDEIVMIGDDIVSDVAGAQTNSIRGIQVRTGKWRFVICSNRNVIFIFRNLDYF
jgi:phospholysine phosphohistidine inorganic pyrophosphate phosphatase